MKLYKKKEWKKLDKGFRQGYNTGIIFGEVLAVLIILVLTFYLYLALVGSIDFGQGNLLSPLVDKLQSKAYERIANNWGESEFVRSLSYICSLQKTEIEKVRCVYHYVNNTFNYTLHGWKNQLRGSPEEIINKSGVCRDYSVLFFSLYEKMGFECNFIHKPSHIYINITCKDCDFYCNVDMDKIWCFEN